MATAERVLWETITVVVFLLLLAGTVFWSGSRVERHRERLEADFEARMSAAAEERRQAEVRLEEEYERRSHEYLVREAEAVFQAFEAGVRSAVASRWGNYVNRAKSNLLVNSRVRFVHILTPSGRVLASSDDAVARGGRMNGSSDWALQSTEIRLRDGAVEGALEVAGPVAGNNAPVAFIWMGYGLEAADSAAAEPADDG